VVSFAIIAPGGQRGNRRGLSAGVMTGMLRGLEVTCDNGAVGLSGRCTNEAAFQKFLGNGNRHPGEVST
jgi:hypothetical protein